MVALTRRSFLESAGASVFTLSNPNLGFTESKLKLNGRATRITGTISTPSAPFPDTFKMLISGWIRVPSNPNTTANPNGLFAPTIFQFGSQQFNIGGNFPSTLGVLVNFPPGASGDFSIGNGGASGTQLLYDGFDIFGNPIKKSVPAITGSAVGGSLNYDQWYLVQSSFDVSILSNYQATGFPPTLLLPAAKVGMAVSTKPSNPPDSQVGWGSPDFGSDNQIWTQDALVQISVSGWPMGIPWVAQSDKPPAGDIGTLDLYEVMVWFGTYLDLRAQGDLFYTRNNRGGIDPAPQGRAAKALGTPDIYFTGPPDMFATNKGTAGDFMSFSGTLSSVSRPSNAPIVF